MRHWYRLGQGITVALVVSGVLWLSTSLSQAAGPKGTTAASKGRQAAPDFSLPSLDGKTVKLSDSQGKVRIVDFWATWCPPCRQEIPHFQTLHTQYGSKGLVVIGVSLDEQGMKVVRPFAQKMKMTYPQVLGNQQTAVTYGGIEAIPTTFIIDKAGRVYKKYVGYQDLAVLEKDVKTLLAE